MKKRTAHMGMPKEMAMKMKEEKVMMMPDKKKHKKHSSRGK